MPSTPRMIELERKASTPGEGLSRDEVTADLVRSLLSYDPDTGIFIWRLRDVALFVPAKGSAKSAAKIWNARWPGTVAGSKRAGYVLIAIRDKLYSAHRLAWLYVHGNWPAEEVDHINGVRDDNRLCNLREATKAQNMQNRAKQANATSRHIGVYWVSSKSRWAAEITLDGRHHKLGHYASEEEAAKAYADAKQRLHQFQPTLRIDYTAANRYLDSPAWKAR